MKTYLCPNCATRVERPEWDDMPVCSVLPTCGFLFPEDEVPRFQVGDVVMLHHAKSKTRKQGTVVSVGRTNVKIDVALYSMPNTITTRKISDPDVLLAIHQPR